VKSSHWFIAFFLFIIILAVGFFLNPADKIISSIKQFYFQTNNAIFSQNKNSDVKDFSKQSFSQKDIIKAVYVTSWSASKKGYIDYLINLASTTEINAAVIDIKDFSGYVAYDTKLPQVEEYKSKQTRIGDMDFLIRELHEKKIYVIGRITVFQDPILASARPDLAVRSISQGSTSSFTTWTDNWGLAWIDPAARDAWEYNASIAKDALNHGFDELNFDYVRFPSDGDLQDMVFPFWNGKDEKHVVIRDFFQYLRQELPNTKISIDLFGLSTINTDDLGVGQIIEDGYEYFDYICPMVYPSHYAADFSGYPIPSQHPYEVVKKSMENALRRLKGYNQVHQKNAKLRPWLQDFTLTIPYDAEMVKAEIKAAEEATGEDFNGFMIWNSQNIYTEEALRNNSF